MKKCLILLFLLLTFSFAAINVSAHHEPATNKDGSIVTNVLTASFDPFGQSSGRAVTPFPTNLGFFTTKDLTTETEPRWMIPTIIRIPRVALNALDGYSLIEKWITGFAANPTGAYDNNTPGLIDPTTVTTGQSVRMFEVTTSQFLFVTALSGN